MKTTFSLRGFLALVLCLLVGIASLSAAPSSRADTRPDTRPQASAATKPTTRLSRKDMQRLQQLTRKSIELFEKKKYDEVEKVLNEALSIAPDEPTNLYNLACLNALKGRPDPALDCLEKAALAGFTDFVHIQRDTDLESLRNLPRYKALMGRKEELQRKAAARVVEGLKEQFGQGYQYEIDDQDKLIFATNTDALTLEALKKNLIIQARSQWRQLFEHRPDQYISVVLPSQKDYRKIVPGPGIGGFYNDADHILISQQLGQVMTHEFTHALHAADTAPLGQEHPIWLIEGLATFYEASTIEGDQLIPHDNFRLPYLQAAAKTNRLLALDKILKMEQREFVSKATLAYGQSGSVLLYLYEQKLLRKFYDAFKAGYDKDKSGKAALEEVTGQKLADIEKAWRAWMEKRTPPVTSTGPNGAFIGIQFGQGNDGLVVADVVVKSPAAKSGIKVGDVIVGVGGIDVRDSQSLLPLLKQHKPGETITLKVRRGEKYEEIAVTLAKRSDVEPVAVPNTQPAPGTRPRRRRQTQP